MARFLSVQDYGVLAALFYLVYVLGIFAESIQTVFSKQSSIERENEKMKNIIKRAMKKVFVFSIIFYFLYLIIALPFSIYKQISYPLFILNGLFIFTILLLPVVRGVMQGRKQFFSLGANLLTEASIKLFLSLFFVFIGWKIYGALLGAILGTFVALFSSFFGIKEIYRVKERFAETMKIKEDSKAVFMVTFSLLAFYTADIFIAQIVFSKEVAGYYAIASVLSKAIFWGTQPIGRAMLPIVVEESNSIEKKKDKTTFYNAMTLLVFAIVVALLIFFVFPSEIIEIFAGKEILQSAQILFYLGIGTALLSLSNLVMLHKMSVSKPMRKDVVSFFLMLICGLILLAVFRNSLVEYSLAFVASSLIFFIGSVFSMNKPRQ